MSAHTPGPWRTMDSAPQGQRVLVAGKTRPLIAEQVAQYSPYCWATDTGVWLRTCDLLGWLPLPDMPKEQP